MKRHLNRLTDLTQQDVSGGYDVVDKLVKFGYNAAGQTTLLARFKDLAGTQSIASSAYSYDASELTPEQMARLRATRPEDATVQHWGCESGKDPNQLQRLANGLNRRVLGATRQLSAGPDVGEPALDWRISPFGAGPSSEVDSKIGTDESMSSPPVLPKKTISRDTSNWLEWGSIVWGCTCSGLQHSSSERGSSQLETAR